MDMETLKRLAEYCGGNITERPDGLFQFTMSPLLHRKLRWPEYLIVFESVDKFPYSIYQAMVQLADEDGS